MNNLLGSMLPFATLIGCNNDPESAIAPESEDFLNEVVDIIEESSINRKTIEWPDFKARVLEKAAGAKAIAGTYPAIEEAVEPD